MAYITYSAKRDKITTNIAQYSEQFDNAYWTKTNVTITADNTTPPGGSIATVDRIVETAVNSTHQVSKTFTLTDSTIYTYSVYAKQAERTWIALFITKKDGTTGIAYFNLATGAVGTTSGVTASIVASTSGFYRCIVYASVLTGGTTPVVGFRLASADNTSSYLGVITDGLFAWGSQLILGSAPGEYNTTTSADAHATGSSYTLAFDAEKLDRSTKVTKHKQVSIGGSTETNFQRREIFWAVKTDILEEDDLDQYREAMASIAGGETFTLDPYGTSTLGADGIRTITVDGALSCIMDSDSWNEDREGSSLLYRISFNAKVI